MHQSHGLDVELSMDLEKRVVTHKQRFIRLFVSRYKEMMPSLIVYENNNFGIDFLKVETALRHNYNVVIGMATNDNLMVMGFINNHLSSENPEDLLVTRKYNQDDITFTIEKDLIPKKMTEISYNDNCQTGDFVVLRNKTLTYVSDYEVLHHYAIELAEIVSSRYSLSMQAKINTIFLGEPNDETTNQLVEKIYNGSPYVKMGKMFDPEENIYTFNNGNLASNFVELKREYQNKISELNNMIGINSLGVEKESGVSDAEAKSNRGFTASVSNIYLTGRNHPLEKLNKRFSCDISCMYNDEVASEINDMNIEEGDGSE